VHELRRTVIILRTYIMLIGLPGSGKSTWASNYIAKNPEMDFRVVSSDDIIEEKALLEGLTYGASHKKNIEFAVDEMERRFRRYIKYGANIIHDQTNLSKKTRKKHLAKVKGYEKSAVLFMLEEKLWRQRFEKRKKETGKAIPEYIIKNMTKGFELPTEKEGFDKVFSI
jgi:heterogeneous nuclear ribonucleoprotein U-like protein 1